MSETTVPPPEVDPHAPRRLTRHPTDKVIGGVAGGLGRYFGVDPIVFRLAFAAFALFGGGGVLLYLIAWVALPAGDHDGPAPPSRGGVDAAAWIGLALVVVALLMLGGAMFTVRPGFLFALILLAGGFLLFHHSGQRQAAPSERVAGAERPTTLGETGMQREPSVTGQADSTPPLTAAPPSPSAPPPPRSRLGRFTLALLFLALGTLGFLHGTAVVVPDPGDYAALALACVGVGLLVGAWWGRARWLVPVGIVLIPVAVVTALFPPGMAWDSGAGEVYERPLDPASLASEYSLGAGQMTLDLSELVLPPGRHHVTATLGMGEILVIVPPVSAVEIRAHAGVGQVSVFGVSRSGLRPELQAREPGSSLAGVITLDLRTGFGQVMVVRAGQAFPMGPFGGGRLRVPAVEVF